jgi:hypothetical protein
MTQHLATIVDTNFMAFSLGAVTFSGYADGDALAHSFPGVDYSASSGTDGAVVIVRQHNNFSGFVARTVQGNYWHTALTEMHRASLLAGGISYPLFFKDLKSDLKVTSQQAMIEKHPDFGYGDSAKPWDWGIIVVTPDISGGAGIPV